MPSDIELELYSWKSYAHSDNRLTTGLQVLTLGGLAWRMLGGGTCATGVFVRRSPALLSVYLDMPIGLQHIHLSGAP